MHIHFVSHCIPLCIHYISLISHYIQLYLLYLYLLYPAVSHCISPYLTASKTTGYNIMNIML